jgi:hypothetical protein
MTDHVECPNPECEDGFIYIYNAYAADPLKPEEQLCEFCFGRGFISSGDPAALAN